MNRRRFLGTALAGATALAGRGFGAARPPFPTNPQGLPLVDLHVHPDRSTLAAIAALAREQGVRYGLVEHAGTKENVYPRVLSSDAELLAWVDELEPHGFLKGIQAEWIDWSGCFSRAALARLDYVLTDAMTMPGPGGRRMKLWEKDAVIEDDAQRFMDRFVDWHVQVLREQPIDVLGNVSWLPAKFAADYERLWTQARIERVVGEFVRQGVALEISSSYQIPKTSFLKLAREAGVKFCFGSNGRYPAMGRLEYSLQAAQALRLSPGDCWLPGGSPPRAAR
ncbi:MAG: hypothetical protein HZC55_26850 [Verrucomicrobia bacterium]|nr:hypothetical protein [Verrucomicrobiota bacterium]